jgi:hypothetical protein
MKARLTDGVQWLALVGLAVYLLPIALLTGPVLTLFGSRPLLVERGTFDVDGTPVRYQVFSLQFSPGRELMWLPDFIRQHHLDWLPAIGSGLRGWLSPVAVIRMVCLPVWQKCLERWP